MQLHTEILSDAQASLFPKLSFFADQYYLVGGTALALQMGHRKSIDFDLFTSQSFDNNKLISWTQRNIGVKQVRINQTDQLTLLSATNVQLTWYHYEWSIEHQIKNVNNLTMPDELQIACMKAFAMGHRAKWKDYVDMYFLLQKFPLKQIVEKTTAIFGAELFDEGMLRGQLSYFEDIDYSENVDFMPGYFTEDQKIKDKLLAIATDSV